MRERGGGSEGERRGGVGRGPEGENEGGCEGEGRKGPGVCCRIVGYLSDCLSACFANCLCTGYTLRERCGHCSPAVACMLAMCPVVHH